MEHERVLGHEVVDQGLIGDRALNEPCAIGNGFGQARKEVVQNCDLSAELNEALSYRSPDEARTACDEDAPTAKSLLEDPVHLLTPVRSSNAGRNRRHQSRSPRILVYPPRAW